MIDQEKLYAALDMISKGVTQPTKIARAMGMSYRNYCNWMVRSNSGDPQFLTEFNGEEVQWAAAIKLATRLALFELRGQVLQESIYGYPEVQTFQGTTVWTPCPIASAIPKEEREWMGYREDGLLTDQNGALVPLTINRKAPWAQQARLLEAAFSDMRPTSNVNQTLSVSGAVGVGYAKPIDYSKGPPPIPAAPPRPELPAPVDADFSEIAEPDDLEDLLGPEPEPVAVNVSIAVEMPPEGNVYSSAPTEREQSPAQEGLLRPRDALAVTRVPNPTPLQKSLYDAIDQARMRRDASK